MSEFFETINENADRASAQEQAERKAQESDLAKWLAEDKLRQSRARKRATIGLILRFLAAMICWVLLALAYSHGLIDLRLAGPAMVAVLSWISIWAGAWMQFMFAKGGLLCVTK